MIACGARGAMVNLSSRSVRGTPVGVHYSATRAGIIGLIRSMALTLAQHGIRVNAIAPGTTDPAQPRYGNTEDELQAFSRALPLGRLGRAGRRRSPTSQSTSPRQPGNGQRGRSGTSMAGGNPG